jgi:lysophospholipase L1-like esterase
MTAPAEAQGNGGIVPAAGAGKSWVLRNESINARVKQGGVGMIFVGDSVVQGWEEKGKKAWETFYTKRKGVNLGIAGDTAQNIVWRLEHGNVEGIAPRLAIVMMGTDYGKDGTAEEIAAGVKAVADKLKEKLPKSRVLMVGILPQGAKDDARRAVTTKANELIKKQADAKAGVFYHDVGHAFLGDDGAVPKDLTPDGVHLTEKGYQVLGDFLDSMIGSLLNETKYTTTPVPQAMNEWWYAYVKTLSARVKEGNVDMIFVGDSLANGYVNTGKETWDKYYAKRNAVNLGISTNNTQNELWQLEHGNIDGISPKLAVVLVGTGNAVSGGTTEDAAAGVKAVVDTLRTKLPKTKILLLALFPRGETKDFPTRVANEKVNAIISKYGDDKMVFYMDINKNFLNEDGTIKKELYKPDMVHLDSKGYAAWAEAIEETVKKLMGEK